MPFCITYNTTVQISKLPLGNNTSTITVHWAIHEMGFHIRAAAHKPKTTMCNTKCQLEWCKAYCHQMLEQWKHVFQGDELHFTI